MRCGRVGGLGWIWSSLVHAVTPRGGRQMAFSCLSSSLDARTSPRCFVLASDIRSSHGAAEHRTVVSK